MKLPATGGLEGNERGDQQFHQKVKGNRKITADPSVRLYSFAEDSIIRPASGYQSRSLLLPLLQGNLPLLDDLPENLQITPHNRQCHIPTKPAEAMIQTTIKTVILDRVDRRFDGSVLAPAGHKLSGRFPFSIGLRRSPGPGQNYELKKTLQFLTILRAPAPFVIAATSQGGKSFLRFPGNGRRCLLKIGRAHV